MIEGLKLHVKGSELQAHANARAEHHRTRAAELKTQFDLLRTSLEASPAAPTGYSNADPRRSAADDMEEKIKEKGQRAEYFTFAAEHIQVGETYVLSRSELDEFELVRTGHGRGW